MTERPLFIDPIALGEDPAVDDAPAPAWFRLVALLLLFTAAYYAFTFWNGPRDTYRHDFRHGQTVNQPPGDGETETAH